MRMDGQEESSNVEDVRGMSGGRGGGFGIGGRGIGLGSVVVAVIAGWIFGINPLALLGMMSGGGGQVIEQPQGPAPAPPSDDAGAKFVSQVLRSTETVWTDVFRQAGRTYPAPKLVLFKDEWQTGCGGGVAQMGPFYCPADQKVYLDLGFFDELKSRFGAPGDFAMAYVIAHEFGHHIQTATGVSQAVQDTVSNDGSRSNELSVKQELQADCLAGVWAHSAISDLEPGDVEEALTAAAAVGDDRIQQSTTGRIDPESWTHGSSQQRQAWFTAGYRSGNVGDCDTFSDG